MTAIIALIAAFAGLRTAPDAGGREGAGIAQVAACDHAAWSTDGREAPSEASVSPDSAEPEDRQADGLAPPAGLWIPETRLVGATLAFARCGPGSHDVGALRARGPPAPRA